MSAVQIPVVGIIGGIGSGKTSIAKAIGEGLSVYRIDADAVGHSVLLLDSVKTELRKTFGDEIFDESDQIVRPKVANLVFGNKTREVQARQQLEAIVHPAIQQAIQNQLKEIQDQQQFDVIILDAALLLEAGWASMCDVIVFLDVPEKIRFERVQKRGWTKEQFLAREQSQLSIPEKRQRADISINNDQDLNIAARQFTDWFQSHFKRDAISPQI